MWSNNLPQFYLWYQRIKLRTCQCIDSLRLTDLNLSFHPNLYSHLFTNSCPSQNYDAGPIIAGAISERADASVSFSICNMNAFVIWMWDMHFTKSISFKDSAQRVTLLWLQILSQFRNKTTKAVFPVWTKLCECNLVKY